MSTSPIDAVVADLSMADEELGAALAACETCRADFDALSTTAAGMATALAEWCDRALAPALPHPDVPAARTDGLQKVTFAETSASTMRDGWLAGAQSVATQVEATRMAAKSAAASAHSAASDYAHAVARFTALHAQLEVDRLAVSTASTLVDALTTVAPDAAANVLTTCTSMITKAAERVDLERLELDQQLLIKRPTVTPVPASPHVLRSKLASAAYRIRLAATQAAAAAGTLRQAAAS